jgi:hypothetical protein
MNCNDLKCGNRKSITEKSPCINRVCSNSDYIETFKLKELISQVEITDDCSSEVMSNIDNSDLKPLIFKLPGESWKKILN